MRVPSLSCVMEAPFTVTRAKAPRAREYVRTSARILQSVSPSTCRPTGPAAAEASAPILNLLESILSIPLSFMTSMTTSIASPPICNPQLPPVTEKGAGALHPELVRQVAIPLPCRPPKTKTYFDHRGYDCHALRGVKKFLRNPLVRRSH